MLGLGIIGKQVKVLYDPVAVTDSSVLFKSLKNLIFGKAKHCVC